jgi:hypothetical protein
VPPFVLTVLKVVFLALLYFFIYRAIRAVVVDLRAGAAVAARTGEGRTSQAGRQSKAGRGKVPRMIVVMDETGAKAGTHRLDGSMQIGRAEGCHIQLTDTYASQYHARVFGRDGTWFVEDLGSTNGTYLNQRRVAGTPTELHAGDRLKIGKTVLELRR